MNSDDGRDFTVSTLSTIIDGEIEILSVMQERVFISDLRDPFPGSEARDRPHSPARSVHDSETAMPSMRDGFDLSIVARDERALPDLWS
jgi:hypothetical protein